MDAHRNSLMIGIVSSGKVDAPVSERAPPIMPKRTTPATSAKKSTKTSGMTAEPPTPAPQWPRLQPLAPSSDLSLEVLLADQIILIRKLFTSSLSKQYVSFLSSLPLSTTPGKPNKGEALRVNDRYQVDDPEFANRLWSDTALKDLVTTSSHDWGGEVVGLNPRIRIYRYGKGQFFDQHYDESNVINLPTIPTTPAKTTWTLLLYLTGPETGCIGGETTFYPELGQAKAYSSNQQSGTDPISVTPEVGLALLHKHGNDCLLHEGKEVKEGEKWIIRSDLCVRR